MRYYLRALLIVIAFWIPSNVFGKETPTFLSLCLNPGSDSIKHTITVLKQHTKSSSCEEASAALASIKEIWISDEGIESLEPFSFLVHLNKLELPYNQIRDLKPLSKLQDLLVLDLSGNQISDISPISHLKLLSELDLTDNKIEDTSALNPLTDLIYLELSENPIEQNRTKNNCSKEALSEVLIEFCTASKDPLD